jgi:hypothetical protein
MTTAHTGKGKIVVVGREKYLTLVRRTTGGIWKAQNGCSSQQITGLFSRKTKLFCKDGFLANDNRSAIALISSRLVAKLSCLLILFPALLELDG